MKLSEIIETTLVDSGQFIVGDIEAMFLDTEKFWLLVQTVLVTYQRHRPYKWNETVQVSKTHTFTEQFEDDSVPEEQRIKTKTIPEWVSEVLPVGVGNVYNNNFALNNVANAAATGFSRSEAREPMQWVWKYTKPTLYIPYTGRVDILCVSKYICNKEFSTGGDLRDVDIVGLEHSRIFMDMVTGKFMQAIGRSRRAFTLDDLPVTSDSDSLVSEGKELYDNAYELLEDRNDWSLAIGN